MTLKNPMNTPLFEEDTGGSYGNNGNEDFAAVAGGVFDTEEGVETQTTETTPPQTESAAPPSLTPEQITAAVREGVRPPEQQKEYTQAELDKIFKVWEPDEGLVTKLMAGGTESIEALKLMREGLAGQFGQLIKYQLEVMKRELAAQYDPAVTFANEARSEKQREEFYKANEELRDHSEFVNIAYQSLLGEGKKFATLAEANKALADRAKKLIPNGNGSGTVQPNSARQQTTTTKPRPATLSVGGGAGGGGGGSATPNVFHEIFGPR